jgi:hypothetical protein
VLRVSRAWSLRPWARKLLGSALELLIVLWLVLIRLLGSALELLIVLWLVLIRLLTIASCLTSWTERNSRR